MLYIVIPMELNYLAPLGYLLLFVIKIILLIRRATKPSIVDKLLYLLYNKPLDILVYILIFLGSLLLVLYSGC